MGSNCKKIYLRGSRMKILKSIRNLFWVRKSTSIKNQSSFIIYQSKGLQFTSQNIVKNGGVAGGTRLLHAGGMGKSCSNLDRLACKSHSLSSLFFHVCSLIGEKVIIDGDYGEMNLRVQTSARNLRF